VENFITGLVRKRALVALTEGRLDLLAYRMSTRRRVDLCREALTVNLDLSEHGIVPSGVLLVEGAKTDDAPRASDVR
jgi:hypothetical protein